MSLTINAARSAPVRLDSQVYTLYFDARGDICAIADEVGAYIPRFGPLARTLKMAYRASVTGGA